MPPLRLGLSVPVPACRCNANVHVAGSGDALAVAEAGRFVTQQCACCGESAEVGAEVAEGLTVVSTLDAANLLLAEYGVLWSSDVPVYEEEVVWLTAHSRSSALSVRMVSAEAGEGVFAEDAIPQGVLLGEYGGLLTLDAPVVSSSSTSVAASPYAIAYPALHVDGRGYSIDAANMGSLMRKVNHASGQGANCAFAIGWYGREGQEPVPVRSAEEALPLGPARVFVITLADIEEGQQLLVDYGAEYWSRAGTTPQQLA